MVIEVTIIDEETYFEVQIWNVEEQEREEDLERTFDTQKEASDYVNELVQDKRYIVQHRDF